MSSTIRLRVRAKSSDPPPGIWTGEPARDAHLRSADSFDVENHPKITFSGSFTEHTAGTAFKREVELTIRGVTRTVPLDISYLGEWKTPWCVARAFAPVLAGRPPSSMVNVLSVLSWVARQAAGPGGSQREARRGHAGRLIAVGSVLWRAPLLAAWHGDRPLDVRR
jgi:hypothetical protein